MKPDYLQVLNDVIKKEFVKERDILLSKWFTADDTISWKKSAGQGYSVILVSPGFEYISDRIIDTFHAIDKNDAVTVEKINYKNMLPVELRYYVAFASSDINEISDFEEYFINQYKDEKSFSAEVPIDCDKRILFSFHVDDHGRKAISKDDRDNKIGIPIYMSQYCLKSNNSISFMEKYSAAQIDLVEGIKDGIIERLSAIEKIKTLLIDNNAEEDDISDLDAAWKELDVDLNLLQGQISYAELYKCMVDNKCSVDEALKKIEEIEGKKEKIIQEEIKRKEDEEKCKQQIIDKANTQFVKHGDPCVNRYTDVIAAQIKSLLNDIENLTVYAGSNYMDYFKNKTLGTLKYPCVVIDGKTIFMLDKNRYVNVRSNGDWIFRYHDFINSLPIQYHIEIGIYGDDAVLQKKITDRISEAYKELKHIMVDDPMFHEEKNVIELQITGEKTGNKPNEGKGTIAQTVLEFKKTFCVYYPNDISKEEAENNPRLQYRMLQLAQYYLCCFSTIKDKAISKLKTDFNNLITNKSILFGAFETPGMKQLKQQFRSGQPISRDLFDSELKTITNVYPLFDRMTQGLTYSQMESELNQLVEVYANKWKKMCELLDLPYNVLDSRITTFGKHNASTWSNEGLVFCINHMCLNHESTVDEAVNKYREHMREEYKAWKKEESEKQERILEQQRNNDYYEGYNFEENRGPGVIRSVAEYASEKRAERKAQNAAKNMKPHLMGSTVCWYGKKRGGFTVYTCAGCPVRRKCADYH